jgi:hypothetical protein
MPRGKIRNHQEMRDWIESGQKYNWIVDEYQRKYNEEITVAGVASYRSRHGLTRRQVRADDLVPWFVEEPHRNLYLLEMLRLEARIRAGAKLSERELKRNRNFRENLAAADAVVHYDPTSEAGFYYVPRLETDDDIIRRPAQPTRKMRSHD